MPDSHFYGRPFAIEPEWKQQKRTWGHSFHTMCSYLGSHPAALAHAFVSRYSRPGDVVLDPFCGRGTTPLQACAEGRIGVGNDINPLAVLLTRAKVDAPSRQAVLARTNLLRIDWSREAARWIDRAQRGEGAPIVADMFHPTTLGQLLFLRATLDAVDRTDRFILAAALGILHGRSASYLTPAMPNTFSLPPAYVQRTLRLAGAMPERELFARLEAKLGRLYRDPVPSVRGISLEGDATSAGSRVADELRRRSLPPRVRLVLTSPPYLSTLRYGLYNWLRLWLLGSDDWRPADIGSVVRLDAARAQGRRSAVGLSALLRATLAGLRAVLADDAVVVLVLGDVARQHGRETDASVSLAETAWRDAAEPEGYLLCGSVVDPVAAHRKTTAMWGREAGRASDVDRLLVIAPTEAGRRRGIAASAVGVDWSPRRGATRRRPGRPAAVGILGPDAAALPPRRPGGHGSARPDEEPRSRPNDEPAPQLHTPAAGAPVHARGEQGSGRDRPVRRGGAADRVGDGAAAAPRLN